MERFGGEVKRTKHPEVQLMRRYLAWAGGLVLGIGLILAARPAQAVIMRLTPLSEVLSKEDFIFTAKVDSLDPDKPAVVLLVDEDLKGKAPFRKLAVSLKGDSDAEKEKQTPQLLKRLAPNLPIILFVNERGKNYVTFAYSNGTWFQLIGAKDDEAVRWRFQHFEPYFRRTFKDSTADLRQVVIDGLAEKKKPPEPDPKAEPGLGPEVKTGDQPQPDEGGQVRVTGGPMFAVVPSVLIAGPIAILALLFPTVFGGLALFLRRWLVVLSIVSLNSTLFMLHDWLRLWIQNSWWASPLTLWVTMTLITLAGVLWAWRRHLAALHKEAQAAHPSPQPLSPEGRRADQAPLSPGGGGAGGEGAVPAVSASVPHHREHVVLWALSLVGLGIVGACLLWQWPMFDASWRKPLLVMWVGVWAGTLYTLYLRWRWAGAPAGRGAVPAEGVILTAMAFGCIGLGLTTLPRSAVAGELTTAGDEVEADGAKLVGQVWKFEPKERGVIYSSPLVAGDWVYVAVAHGSAFDVYGRLYCVNRATGKQVWEFDSDGDMKQVFSTPCVADGRIYIGEGFHQDKSCRLFCLDAATGQKKWEFATGSHTESSPVVAGGNVYFGAGDDGVYCVDAATGQKVWQYPGLHVDCSPAVVGHHLYAGSGVGDIYRETCVFCLDADTGKEVWREAVNLPVWGSPAPAGKYVYYGIGNGNYLMDEESKPPAGALLCVRADSGRQAWRADVSNGVLDRPAVDRHAVYFGSRDGNCYCVDRRDGRLRWKHGLGSAVVAAVALARSPGCGSGTSLYAVGGGGRVVCLDPDTGEEAWSLDMLHEGNAQPELYSSPAVVVSRENGIEHRRIFFGSGMNNYTSKAAVLFCYEDKYEDQ
jgi:outer membrane protein assembly factor BamB